MENSANFHELPPLDRKITVRHRVEYAAFASVVGAAGLLSAGAARRLGESLGALGGALRIRRDVALDNLRHAFPDKDEEWIHDVAGRAYAHLGREALNSIRLGTISKQQLIDMTIEPPGIRDFRAAMDAGQGAVIISGHVGNHEIAGTALAARGFAIDAVVQRQENPLFDRALNGARMKHGLGIIDRSKALKQAIKSLRAGRAVAFASDQDAGRNGVFVPFFGRLASTHRGAALFAVKTGAPAFMGAAVRVGSRYQGYLERLEVDRDGELDDVVYRIMAAFTRRLEEVVRTAPDQYLWMHRRWKTPPPEELKDPEKV